MEKMIFEDLLESMGVPLQVYPLSESKGRYEDTEWVPAEPGESFDVTEPFVPYSVMTQLPISLAYTEGGAAEKYEMIWFSTHTVPLKSTLVHDGTTYSIEEAIPYTDYSDVTQYGCKAVKNFAKQL